jgi:branched-chain amino acid transport system ATP-binding protein
MSILRTEKLSRRFGGLLAVSNVDFSMERGEIVGIIGPNGAGKTTFINVVSGIYMPSGGTITFNGKDITYMPAHIRARLGIGRTFQIIHPLENLNLLQNVMTGFLFCQRKTVRAARIKAVELCESLGLDRLERPVSQLTILETKKMEIAHALSTDPGVLFLDEVMAGLNTDEMMEMIRTVKQLAKDRDMAVGVVEHVMGVIDQLTERVVVLDAGEIIASGPYAEVASNQRVIQAYLGGDYTNVGN